MTSIGNSPLGSNFSENIASNASSEAKLLHRLIYESSARILFITGAGISVKSGIPLYRTDATTEIQKEMKKEIPGKVKEGSTIKHIEATNGNRQSNTNLSRPLGSSCCADNAGHEPYVDISDDDKIGQSTNTNLRSSSSSHSDISECHKSIENSSLADDLSSSDEQLFPRDNSQKAIWDAKLEALCTRQAFLFNPKDWYRYFWFDTHHVDAFLKAVPNETHIAIGLLCSKFANRIHCITQNVDNLHHRGGCPHENLIEIHGRIGVYRCSNCQCPNSSLNPLTWEDLEFMTDAEEELIARRTECFMSVETIFSRIYKLEKRKRQLKGSTEADNFRLPCCPSCREPAIPMTLMFDEEYTTHDFFQFSKASKWIEQSDVLVFCGTSFSVYFTERAVHFAREEKKMVFNINIRREDSEFFGFKNLIGGNVESHKRQPSLSSLWRMSEHNTSAGYSSIGLLDRRKIELDGSLLERRRIQLEFDSTSDNDDDHDPPVYKAVDGQTAVEDSTLTLATSGTVNKNPGTVHHLDLETCLAKTVPYIVHIVSPADQAFMSILSDTYRKEILLRLKKQTEQLQRAKFRAVHSLI